MSDTDELAAIARELSRHADWAGSLGERELPRAAGAAPAAPLVAARAGGAPPAAPAAAARAPAGAPAAPAAAARAPTAAPAPAAAAARAPAAPGVAALAPAAPSRSSSGSARSSAPLERSATVTSFPAGPRADPPAGTGRTLEQVRSDLGDCQRCKLCSSRKSLVFGVGDPAASLVFVGEGPGADEDEQGIPFVGAAGQLLTRMIGAMGFSREAVYICNVVKCRPPGNRNPEPDEIGACEPFLMAQLGAIRPKVIVTLGKFAAQTLLRDPTPITRLRGKWRSYEGVRLMPTFHPAYLLRSPAEKSKAWEDLKLVMAELGTGGRS